MITDKIDGDLARKHNLVTNFGKLADPIADKALTGMAFVGLSIIGQLWWWVTIVLLVREWGITLMRFVVKKHGVMPAGQNGKIKTTLQALAIGGYLLPLEIWDNPPSDVLRWITHIAMAAALAITLSTGVATCAMPASCAATPSGWLRRDPGLPGHRRRCVRPVRPSRPRSR